MSEAEPSVTYESPNGLTTENPAPEFVRELVWKTDHRYWTSHGEFVFRSGDRESRLYVYDESQQGMQILFHAPPSEMCVAFVGDLHGEMSSGYDGQIYSAMPSAIFLDYEIAERVVSHFVERGAMFPDVQWKPYSRVPGGIDE